MSSYTIKFDSKVKKDFKSIQAQDIKRIKAAILELSNKDFSKQSSRERRTVEATRKPLVDQSSNKTSVLVRGLAEVTTATMTSLPSSQSIKTGRFLEFIPLVKGMSATQNSPDRIIII